MKRSYLWAAIILAILVVTSGVIYTVLQPKSTLILPSGYALSGNVSSSSSSPVIVSALLGSPDPYSSSGGIFFIAHSSRVTGEIESNIPVAFLILTRSEAANISSMNLSNLTFNTNIQLNESLSPGGYEAYFAFNPAKTSTISLSVTKAIIAFYVNP